MRKIRLGNGQYTKVDDEDYDWLKQWRWRVDRDGYPFRYVRFSSPEKPRGKRYLSMHRFILRVTNPQILCDHIDHDKRNNQKSNLRLCSPAQNTMHTQKQLRKNTTSKYKGVSVMFYIRKSGEKIIFWLARIRFNHTKINLGIFNKEIDAAKAYNEAAKKYHGDFAVLNDV